MPIHSVQEVPSHVIHSSRRSSVPLHRRALHAFLIAGVLSGEAPAQDLYAPEDPTPLAGEKKKDDAPMPFPDLVAEGLIEELNDDFYLRRDSAQQRLIDHVLPKAKGEWEEVLQKGLDSKNAEVRLRCEEVRRQKLVDELWKGPMFEYPAGTVLSSDLLKSFVADTETMLMLGDQYGAFDDKEIVWSGGRKPYWEVLDEVCRLSKNKIRPHYDVRNPGLVITGGNPGKYPLAYAGPLRMQIMSVRRAFSDEVDHETGKSDISHTFQVNMQMMWADDFRIVSYQSQPELVRAKSKRDQELRGTQPSVPGWNTVSAGNRMVTMNIRLQPPKLTEKLDELVLSVGVIAVADMQALVIDDFKEGNVSHKDDVELTLHAFDASKKGRCELTVGVLRDTFPESQEVFFLESGMTLFDQRGQEFRKQGQTNSIEEGEARMKATFVGESEDSVPAKLSYEYPRIRSKRTVQFRYEDLLIPSKRPD